MENVKNPPVITGSGEGQTVSVVGDTYRVLVSGKETGGAFAVIDMLIPPGGGPGPHAHPHFHESFYVIDGEIEVRSEAGSYTAGKGTFVLIPEGGVVHCFKNKSDRIAHIVCTVAPSGLEEFFIEIGQPVAVGAFLPPPDEEAMKKILPIAERYGTKVYPPDYLG